MRHLRLLYGSIALGCRHDKATNERSSMKRHRLPLLAGENFPGCSVSYSRWIRAGGRTRARKPPFPGATSGIQPVR